MVSGGFRALLASLRGREHPAYDRQRSRAGLGAEPNGLGVPPGLSRQARALLLSGRAQDLACGDLCGQSGRGGVCAVSKPTPEALEHDFPGDAAMIVANDVVPSTSSQALVVAVAHALYAFATSEVEAATKQLREERDAARAEANIRADAYMAALTATADERDAYKAVADSPLGHMVAHLKSERDALRAEVDALRQDLNDARDGWESAVSTNVDLRAEIEQMREASIAVVGAGDELIANSNEQLDELRADLATAVQALDKIERGFYDAPLIARDALATIRARSKV